MADLSRRSTSRAEADGDLKRRAAWWLVWVYPPRFRRDVGQSLVDALDDRMRAGRAAGEPRAAIWTRMIGDTLRNAAAEWVDVLRAAVRRSTFDLRRTTRDAPHTTNDARQTANDEPRTTNAERRSAMDTLLQDIRYALRLWRRRPGFALVAVVTLALGIGANTAMFSIVNAVLLRPLPYAHADRLVSVWGRTALYPRGLISYQEYEEIRKQRDTFEAMGLFFGQSVNLTGVDQPQRIVGSFVTASFFDVLGLKAERGRLFDDAESAPGTVKPVVVLSHQTWQRRFNGDASAIGATMILNGTPLTVIGVMAPPFDAGSVPADGYFVNADVFLPVAQFPAPNGLYAAGPQMLGVARLKEGVTVSRATSDLDVILRRLSAANAQPQPGSAASFVAQGGRILLCEPAQEGVVGASRPALFLLFAAVGAVLLIACVNVSQLLLARAIDRQKEIALRSALGASRGAVARQLAVEASLTAVVAASLGFLLGRWALSTLAWLRPPASVPIPTNLPLDATVLLFTGGVALVVALLCALAPAVKSARPDPGRVLQAGFKRASGTGGRTRDAFMVVEIALSVALVAVSALLIQSLLAIQQAPIGFDASNVFTLQFRLPPSKYRTPEDIARFFKASIERVRAVPAVESAALVRAVPFSGNGGTIAYAVEGRPAPDPAPQALSHLVTPDYFRTMRIPLLKGRDFTDRDDAQAPLAAVINDTFARRVFAGEDPIGKRLTTPQTPSPLTIIGVVGDAKHYAATDTATPQLYIAHYQVPLIFSSLVARTKGPAMSVANDVRKAIWSVDKDQPLWSVSSLEDIVARTRGQSRFLALLLGIFAGVALLLAGVGIYGVTSYGVAQRTHEIGIRIALGASSERVLREVVGRGLRLTLVGVAGGLVTAVMMARLASAVLFAVTPADPAALAAATIILALVSMAACIIPARRAARVDPVVALAEE